MSNSARRNWRMARIVNVLAELLTLHSPISPIHYAIHMACIVNIDSCSNFAQKFGEDIFGPIAGNFKFTRGGLVADTY